MKSFLLKATMAIALSSLASCGGDSKGTTSDGDTSATVINVTNTLGGKTDITGTWITACFAAGGAAGEDVTYLENFSGTRYTLVETSYATSDGSCGGATTEGGKRTSTFSILTTDAIATAGWIDGQQMLSVAAPVAQDGVTTLPVTPSATILAVTVVTSSGTLSTTSTTFKIQYVVDASVETDIALYVLYDDGINGWVADASEKSVRQ